MQEPITVCLDARIHPGAMGGVEQYVSRLGRALLDLNPPDQRYVFLVHDAGAAWARAAIGPDARLLSLPAGRLGRGRIKKLRRRLKRAVSAVTRPLRRGVGIPDRVAPARSPGVIERAGVDLMHFTYQAGFLTAVPTVYQPHDVQHLHLPQFFSPHEIRKRETLYRAYCAAARAVPVSSEWTRQDLIRQYGLPPDRVHAVQYPPPHLDAPEPTPGQVADARARLGLPERFVYYAATTFAHKNHLGLLDAIAHLRDERGLAVPLVCSGKQTEHFALVQSRLSALRLEPLVRFVGFVPAADVRAVYRAASAVVIPTRFESASFPLWEAMAEGVPVACSGVTSLPSQAGDAALLFDPASPAQIAEALARLWTDRALGAALVAKARARIAGFTAQRAARTFHALYRVALGMEVTPEQRGLLHGGAIG
ncbi:MAG: glycosyltransferase family 1 protein [Planctomyces sp.]|nr:glycosyltransferase family 1 protein [Planctomyces sp.]MBA4039171.1 glycosyltransferase family 1 protein [Planctomyces sp.]MBA4119312.1 glycosyltransferase family 1 protein [Isosphaera sp.]